jgi:hypothetical protein
MRKIKFIIRNILKIKRSVLAFVLLLIILTSYFVIQYVYTTKEVKNKKEISSILKDVSKHMLIPAEEPNIFDITDPATLSSQQKFFEGSVIGDKLLVYTSVGKAIIWSPSRNIIINSGPIQNELPKSDSLSENK